MERNQGFDPGTIEENNISKIHMSTYHKITTNKQVCTENKIKSVRPNAVMDSRVKRESAVVCALVLGKVTSGVTERE